MDAPTSLSVFDKAEYYKIKKKVEKSLCFFFILGLRATSKYPRPISHHYLLGSSSSKTLWFFNARIIRGNRMKNMQPRLTSLFIKRRNLNEEEEEVSIYRPTVVVGEERKKKKKKDRK